MNGRMDQVGVREVQVQVDLLSQGDMLTATGEGEGVPGGPREMSSQRSPRGTWSSSPRYELHLERADAVDKHCNCEYCMSAPPPPCPSPHKSPSRAALPELKPRSTMVRAAVTVRGRGLTLNRGGPLGATPLVAARASRCCPLHRSSGERKSPPQFASAALPQEAEGYALNGKNRGGTWTVCSRAGRRLPRPALAC